MEARLHVPGIWPKHWPICWWFAGGQPPKAGEGIFYFHLPLELATCRLQVLVSNSIDIDCVAGHFIQLLNIMLEGSVLTRSLLVRHIIPCSCVRGQSPQVGRMPRNFRLLGLSLSSLQACFSK